ncbi:MAG: hypothetical protein MPW15_11415 [Candidatus Manganitrophus sp.]|nr:hypothetical protein [Candidatus Manganitrophus sp.]
MLGYNFGIVPLVNLAVEGSYVDFGTAEERLLGGNAETSVTGWDAFGLVGLNLGPVSLVWESGGYSLGQGIGRPLAIGRRFGHRPRLRRWACSFN